MKYFTSALVVLFSAGVFAQNPMVKISADEMKRIYKVMFVSEEKQDVKIELISATNDVLMSEDISEQTFVKMYSLDKMSEGNYSWKVSYGNKSYAEDFAIRSIKKLMKESISVAQNNLNLDINVKEFNTAPVNIFVYNSDGEQLDYMFWEPALASRTKKIDLTQYDGYEIKLEILQNGDVAYKDEFKLY